MVAALLLLEALATCGAGNGAVLLQPGLESLVMRLILHRRNIDVYLLYLLLKRHLTFLRTFEDQPDMHISNLNCALYKPQQIESSICKQQVPPTLWSRGAGQVSVHKEAEVYCHAQMSSHLLEHHHCY